MSEEREEMLVNETEETKEEQTKAPEAEQESMADYEDRLDPESFQTAKWERFKELLDKKEVFPVTVKGVVKGGVIAYIDDTRAFIPSSHVSLSHIENLETMLEKELEVRVIEADQSKNRLVLSAREVLRDKAKEARKKEIEEIPVGSVFHGKVESLQSYGAFVRLENGMSGLVHVSQIAHKRIKTPSEVLKEGDETDVKVIAIKDGKLSLSIKALQEREAREEENTERVVIPKAEKLATNLGDLLKGIKLQ